MTTDQILNVLEAAKTHVELKPDIANAGQPLCTLTRFDDNGTTIQAHGGNYLIALEAAFQQAQKEGWIQ
jgi:hypothetical protein